MEDERYELYKKAIARIYRSTDGSVVGSGFLVFNRHILTCAHVVADALGIEHTTENCPEGLVEVDFPLPASAKPKQKIKAKVVFWKPISPEGWISGDDIAGLELQEDLTEEVSSIGLVLGNYSWNNFKVMGFPSGYDGGVWTTGELRDELGNGQVQMVVLEQSDYYVEGGFSGAPVWTDTLGGVIGIMAAAELASDGKREKVKASFMIPAKVLSEFWCNLKPFVCEVNKSSFKILSRSPSLTTQPSDNEKIAELLHLLNYSSQEQVFRDAIAHRREGVFLIRTDEERTQRWLMRRLAGCVPDFQQAKKFIIRIHSHPMRSNFDTFWQEFKQEFGGNLNREKIIQGLANLCKHKSVIIAVYGISRLDNEKMYDFHAFWSDLVNQVGLIPATERSFRSRLILLLAEKNSTVLNKLQLFNFIEPPQINKPQYSISLTPLNEILNDDVINWLSQEKVYSLLNRADDEIQSIVVNDIPTWQQEPSEVLEEICQTIFQIGDGITAIEPYWKLVV